MQDVDKLVKQVARLLRKSGVENYDQTKHIFREIRKELDLSPPKRRGRDTVKRISLEQLRSFLDHAQRHSATRGLMMQALYETAVRVDEFVNLRVEHFLYEQRRLVVVAGKGDKRREIPLTSALSNLLRIHNDKRTEGPIFRSTKGSAFTCRRIQQIVDEVASNAVLTTKISPHILRHTRATDLVEAGMTRDQLRSILGHEKSDTTDIYTRTAAALTRDAYDAAARVIEGKL
jgi:site-specific recombinase XerD